MFTTKCPYCKSTNVKKNGIRKGSQFYRCNSCGKQFYGKIRRLFSEAIWEIYLEGKQTITEIAQTLHISESTVKRRLRQKVQEWRQPILYGKHGFVHVDATYWGHNWGIIWAIDEGSGKLMCEVRGHSQKKNGRSCGHCRYICFQHCGSGE